MNLKKKKRQAKSIDSFKKSVSFESQIEKFKHRVRIISTIAFFPFRFNSVKFDNVSVKIATITITAATAAAAACCVSIREKSAKCEKNRLRIDCY